MVLSIYFLSLIFLVLGLIYYYKPQSVQKVNSFFKDRVFNDINILLKRKKIAVVFFITACLLFTSGFIKAQNENEKKKGFMSADTAGKEIIFDAISLYIWRLSEKPEDMQTLTKLAHAYETLGEKKRESGILQKILTLDPENETAKEKLNIKH